MAWEYLKFFHIVSAFVLVTGVSFIQYGHARAIRSQDVRAFGFYLSLVKSGGMMTGLGVVLAGTFGILTAWQQKWPLTDTGWLNAAYAVTIVATILPQFTLKRWGQQAGKMMPQAMQQGKVLPEQLAVLTSPKYRAVDLFMLGLLVFIVVLMVFKPF
jgi:uncharacterized membrane protein